MKDERPDLDVVGIDLNEDAVAVARANARDWGSQLSFVVGDLLDGVDGRFDAVLANLPYVADGGGAGAGDRSVRAGRTRCSPVRTGST